MGHSTTPADEKPGVSPLHFSHELCHQRGKWRGRAVLLGTQISVKVLLEAAPSVHIARARWIDAQPSADLGAPALLGSRESTGRCGFNLCPPARGWERTQPTCSRLEKAPGRHLLRADVLRSNFPNVSIGTWSHPWSQMGLAGQVS